MKQKHLFSGVILFSVFFISVSSSGVAMGPGPYSSDSEASQATKTITGTVQDTEIAPALARRAAKRSHLDVPEMVDDATPIRRATLTVDLQIDKDPRATATMTAVSVSTEISPVRRHLEELPEIVDDVYPVKRATHVLEPNVGDDEVMGHNGDPLPEHPLYPIDNGGFVAVDGEEGVEEFEDANGNAFVLMEDGRLVYVGGGGYSLEERIKLETEGKR